MHVCGIKCDEVYDLCEDLSLVLPLTSSDRYPTSRPPLVGLTSPRTTASDCLDAARTEVSSMLFQPTIAFVLCMIWKSPWSAQCYRKGTMAGRWAPKAAMSGKRPRADPPHVDSCQPTTPARKHGGTSRTGRTAAYVGLSLNSLGFEKARVDPIWLAGWSL